MGLEKLKNLLRHAVRRFFFILLLFDILALVFSPIASAQQNISLKNRLANSPSPYLREAAQSPVHWQPWGEQIFRLAKEMNRPILLDIGAIWCHWCHVMDEQTYGNPEIAKFINENFIPTKVDRDARPDIDERFQLIVSTLTGQGGWPLTVFMTPSGHVFFGGGTFLPENSFGRPGFKALLPRIAEVYQNERDKLTASAKQNYKAIESKVSASQHKGALSQDLVRLVEEDILNRLDPLRGGIEGSRAQFPRAPVLNLAMELYFERGQREFFDLVQTTLDAMAHGGIRDQLMGGFHRYSTDPLWIVPHFEQMDYVQAQLLKTYALAYHLTGKPLYREVMEGIIDYVDTTLLDRKEGGFYAHQDADMGPGDDGGYFTWSLDEINKALLPEEAEIIIRHFDIDLRGDMREDPGKNVLWVAKSPKEIAEDMRISEKKIKDLIRTGKRGLLEARKKRRAPIVDRTKYADRNGLMIIGYLEAYKVLGDETLKATALKSLEFIWRNLYRPKQGMQHAFMDGKPHPPYLLDDQVFVVQALLDGFQVTGDIRYVKRAQILMDLALQHLWDERRGGFLDKISQTVELSALSLPMKRYEDRQIPGPNAIAVLVLNQLYALTNMEIYREKAEATLQGFAGTASNYGMFAATYGQALSRHLNHPAQVVIIGVKSNPTTRKLWNTALITFRPGKFVSVYDPREIDLNRLPPAVQAAAKVAMKDGVPKAYVCVGTTCALPTSSPQEEAKLIRTFGLIRR